MKIVRVLNYLDETTSKYACSVFILDGAESEYFSNILTIDTDGNELLSIARGTQDYIETRLNRLLFILESLGIDYQLVEHNL